MDFSALFKFRQIMLYGFIGLSAVVVDYGIFFALHNFFGWQFVGATATSVFISTVYAFVLNAYFNFQKTDHLFARSLSYFAVSGVGLFISVVILHIFSGRFGFEPNLVKAVSIPFIVAMQYVLNVMISFSHNLFERRESVSGELASR